MKKLILLTVLLAAADALAFGPMEVPGGKWWQNEQIVADLGLTPDQRARLDHLAFEHRDRMIDLRAALEKAGLRLREMMDDVRFDERAALEQIDRVAAARSLVEKHRAGMLVKTRAVLTPEQWAKTRERLMEKRREMRDEKREFRQERREQRRDRRQEPPCLNTPIPDEF
jgi:Spy/CpxP family protein refolding chaperone